MNRRLSAAKRQLSLILWTVLVLASVLLIVWSPNGLLHLRQLHLEHQELTQKNLVLERENYQLYQEIILLHNDTATIERLARQELGLVKEGELVIQFVHPADTNKIPTE